MSWIIDWLVVLAQGGLLAALQLRFPETVGGGAVFIGAAIISMYFARVRRVFPEQLGRLALAAVCLEGLNAVALLEYRGDFRRPVAVAAYLLIGVIFSVLTYQVGISPVRVRRGAPSDPTSQSAQLIKSISAMFLLFPTLALMVGLDGGLTLWIGEESWLVREGWFTVSSQAVFCQLVGALAQRAFLPRITEDQVACVLRVRHPVRVANFERKVGVGLLLLFLMGALGELGRGLWFFYVGSYALWVLTLANGWKVWRHVLSEREVSVSSHDVSPGYNIVEDFRVLLFGILVATAYLIALVALLALTSSKIYR